MKRLSLLICLLFAIVASYAQTFKHIGIDEGLSHRHVYSIEQDARGYIWLLTREGVDRFNGSDYKHYNFYDNDKKLVSSSYLKQLFYTPDNYLWQVGSNGQVFRYNPLSDEFELFYNYPSEQGEVTILNFGLIDNNRKIWLCNKGNLQIYDYEKKKSISIYQHPLYLPTSVTAIDSNRYAIGTNQGVYFASIRQDSLQLETSELLKTLPIHVDNLHYHQNSNKLIIATLKNGLYTYDLDTKQLSELYKLNDTAINKIIDFQDDAVLIATSGGGIYQLNLKTKEFGPFLIADYSTSDGMNGNNIKDIFIDKEDQIWIASYPIGVTICNLHQSGYTLIQYKANNKQSLVHNEVNYIIQDSDGDVWYATTNGISLYRTESKKWSNYLSSFNATSNMTNHIFISLCEVKPGIIWVGGYNSSIYEINKHTGKIILINDGDANLHSDTDRYIKEMITDSQGSIWIGGQFNLRQINYDTRSIHYYNNITLINSIEEKDENNIWIGTAKGLYLLNKQTGVAQQMQLPEETSFINNIFQGENDMLYIGTNNGLMIWNSKSGSMTHLNQSNSKLLSNNIRTVIADRDFPFLYIAYEKELARLNIENDSIINWTTDHNLPDTFFSQGAAIQLKSGNLLFGSINGVIEFDQYYQIPQEYESKLILEELYVNQKRITVSSNNKILSQIFDKTSEIVLPHGMNNISIKVGSINFKYPSNINYSFLLEGMYDNWSMPLKQDKFSFSNLHSGNYVFKVRAISNEDGSVLEERAVKIRITPPIWWNVYSKIAYILILVFVIYQLIFLIRRSYRKRVVNTTKQFYYNTVHDIRVPLQLIKAPIEQLKGEETLSKQGAESIRIILRNLNLILSQNDNIINYERMEQNKNRLFLSESNIDKFFNNIITRTTPIAEIKQIKLISNNRIENKNLKIWLDKSKVDTILSNLINDCISRSEEAGEIKICLALDGNFWNITIKYTGKEITQEQLHFSEQEDAINDAIYKKHSENQSELSLSLVSRLVQIHKGEILIYNQDDHSTEIRVNFPLYIESSAEKIGEYSHKLNSDERVNNINSIVTSSSDSEEKTRVLLVEEDETLIQEIIDNLKDEYSISVVHNGTDAINMAKELRPEIIISKLYLSDMKGTELSWSIKNNIETSHITVILLTEKNDEKHILKGLENGADEFVLKPFNFRILKASMANLLANKKRIRGKYANLEFQEEKDQVDCMNCSTNLDWNFISSVKEKVEEHMAEADFNIDKLCALLNMSRTSFYNKLKDLTDQSPSDFIRFIKLRHAAHLLVTTDISIVEIAERTGFNDAKYFREVFKKHFNMTPSKYAKENR